MPRITETQRITDELARQASMRPGRYAPDNSPSANGTAPGATKLQ